MSCLRLSLITRFSCSATELTPCIGEFVFCARRSDGLGPDDRKWVKDHQRLCLTVQRIPSALEGSWHDQIESSHVGGKGMACRISGPVVSRAAGSPCAKVAWSLAQA